MFKRTATDVDTQQTTTQQSLACAQCACEPFLMPLVARRERRLFRRTNSELHKCVYCSHINMERFTCAELAGIHLVCGAAYGNGGEAHRIYHERFPNSVCPDYSIIVLR